MTPKYSADSIIPHALPKKGCSHCKVLCFAIKVIIEHERYKYMQLPFDETCVVLGTVCHVLFIPNI